MLVILIDDAGFGSSSAFGGPCQTPNAEKLAAGGLKYTRFHDCPVLADAPGAPDRAQPPLRRHGRHHRNRHRRAGLLLGAPQLHVAAGADGSNGYSTAQFGKCHEVPVWQTSPAGPFDAWPTGGGGFEYFYGFIGGEANQWYPTLYEGTTPVEPKKTPEEGYHLVDDMTEKARKWISQQKALAPDKPFFVYFAPGATRSASRSQEWADKYKGKFDAGWDKLREETIARRKSLASSPATATSPPATGKSRPGTRRRRRFKPVLRREMEVYAGFLEYTDHHVGQLLDGLKKLGIFEDTLICTSLATTARRPRAESTVATTR